MSTVEALVTALREQVLDGTLPAGAPLREPQLCETFGVSRHTVRSALQELGHEGIVRLVANRGAFVTDLTADDVIDLFHLRSVLEGLAIRNLAESPDVDLTKLRQSVDRLKVLPSHAPWSELREADLDFHQTVVNSLGSYRVTRTYNTLLTELRLCFLQLQPEFAHPNMVARQHEEMVEAIEAGDVDLADHLMEVHLRNALNDIISSKVS